MSWRPCRGEREGYIPLSGEEVIEEEEVEEEVEEEQREDHELCPWTQLTQREVS